MARATRQPLSLTIWLRLDDPQACLLTRLLPALLEHYPVDLHIRLLPSGQPPSLAEVADAWHMAQWLQLDFPALTPPNPADCLLAERILLGAGESLAPVERLLLLKQLMASVWEHQSGKLDTLALRFPPLDGGEALERLSGWSREASAFHDAAQPRLVFGGEHFLGLTDLPDLLPRLRAALGNEGHIPALPGLPTCAEAGFLVTDTEMLAEIRSHRYQLDFYFCFRDPYSYLALEPVLALADHYSLRLRLLPVTLAAEDPLSDSLLPPAGLLWRSGRAAQRRQIPFGTTYLPDADGALHCHALMQQAEQQGRSRDMVIALLRGIWTQGLDPGRAKHRRAVLNATGLQGCHMAAPTPDTARAAQGYHRDWRQLGIARLPGLKLHIGKGVVLGGEDRAWAMDMVLADSLNNNKTGQDWN